MKTRTNFVLSAMLGMAVLAVGMSEAFAARMGGGRSFGSRPSYSMPYQRSPAPSNPGMAPGMNRPGAPAQQPALSPAQMKNQAMRDSLAQRGGLGRFLGGLALGGLLGALFMGGGFEGINFLDILLFGGVAFLLFKFLAARRQRAEQVATPGGYYDADHQDQSGNRYERQANIGTSGGAGFDTDILSRKAGLSAAQTAASPVPADFDAPGFLEGAKAAYAMMQKAWDKGDLAELRALTTDKVFGELQEQIRARGGAENQTDLLKVEVELLEVRDVGNDREATVLFDVLMREDREARPTQVREVWHFTRSRNSRQPTWFLDGIQQLEE
ncbi:MAG: Tim44 domain-containing protein [Methylococcus sp.]